MKQHGPEVEFIFAHGGVMRAVALGWFLERMGRWGRRRSYIIMYKALKRIMPAISEFSKIPTSPIGVMESDIDNREVRQFIRNIRKRTRVLRRT
jgi:hypothetical protein